MICALKPLQLFASISPNIIGFFSIVFTLRLYPETTVDGVVMATILSVIAAVSTFALAYMIQMYRFENEEGGNSFWIAVQYAKLRVAEGPDAKKEKVTWQKRSVNSVMIAVPTFFVVFIIIFYSLGIFRLFGAGSGTVWWTCVSILAQLVKIVGNKLQILLLNGDTGFGANM